MTGELELRPGDPVRFVEPTSRRLVRNGHLERVIARGKRRGELVIALRCGKRYTVKPSAVLKPSAIPKA